MKFIVENTGWKRPYMYYEEDIVIDVIDKCLEPPINKTEYTIKKKDDKKPDIKLHDIVEVVKIGSPNYGKKGVVVMVNHRSLTPFLVKLGNEYIAYTANDIEHANINNHNIVPVVIDDLFDKQPYSVEMVRSGLKCPIICHYDDREFLLEEIGRMLVDPHVEEIKIHVNGV